MDKIIYKKINVTLPIKLLQEFKQFTEDNGLTVSGRLAILIQEDLNDKRIR